MTGEGGGVVRSSQRDARSGSLQRMVRRWLRVHWGILSRNVKLRMERGSIEHRITADSLPNSSLRHSDVNPVPAIVDLKMSPRRNASQSMGVGRSKNLKAICKISS